MLLVGGLLVGVRLVGALYRDVDRTAEMTAAADVGIEVVAQSAGLELVRRD